MEALLHHMDKDGSGDIDVTEFVRELREAIRAGGYVVLVKV